MDQNTNKKPGMDLGNTQYFKVQPDQETGVKYITNYMGARSLIMKVERDELVEEIMNDYIEFNHWKKK